MSDAKTRIREILRQHFSIEEAGDDDRLIPDEHNASPVRDASGAHLDSLDKVELTMEIEDAFDIIVTDEAAQGLHTIAEFAAFIDQARAEREPQ